MTNSTLPPFKLMIKGRNVVLTEDQTRFFEVNGFASFDQIGSRDETLKIRSILTELFRKRAGENEGALFDTLATDTSPTVQKSLQITNPMNYSAELRKLNFIRSAHIIAKQILGDGAKLTGDFVILKPAKLGLGTPWHQDEAYRDPRFDYHEMTLWMSLQEVAPNSGCMNFIPGSHRKGIYEHRSPGNNVHVHALECCQDLSDMSVVSCPLTAGGGTIHHGRTLHCTSANLSPVPRYAYILVFHIPPTLAREHREFSWLVEKKSAEQVRKRAWLFRGGVFVIVWRKFRRGDFWDIAGIRYAIKRGLSAMRKR